MSLRTALALAALAALLISCSGSVKGPEDAVARMVEAYGGEKNIEKLVDFEGRGFRKKLREEQIATHYPFDIFQRGTNYKTKTYRVNEGRLVDLQTLIISDSERFAWSHSGGATTVPGWEAEIIGFKFPGIVEYLAAGDRDLEHVESEYWDGMYHISFTDGDKRVDIGLDEETWLVRESTITSVSDSAFAFREVYGDYVKTDGIWFPSRFTGYYGGRDYYEFMIPVVVLGAGIADDVFTVQESDTSLAAQ